MISAEVRCFADAPSSARMAFVAMASDLSIATDALGAVADDRDSFVIFAPGTALFDPGLAGLIYAVADMRPDVDVFYGDDVVLIDTMADLRLKPSFNLAMLSAQDYIGAPLIVRGSALAVLGGVRPEAGTAVLYDLVLRAAEQGLGIDAVREVLIAYSGRRPEPTTSDRLAALQGHLARAGEQMDVLPGLTPTSSRVRRRFAPHPGVTLLIATRQAAPPGGPPHIVTFLDSLARSTWPSKHLKVLIADDVSDGSIYGDIERYPFAVSRLLTPRRPEERFNYAAKMNTLWRAAETEHLVLMNDDLEVIADDWLEALMTFAVDKDVGGVGARLFYPNGSLQHAGMIGGLFGVFAHPWIDQSIEQPTYGDWALVQRDWSAVTGAVFATRRSALDAVNGFDERFTLEYNDVDICLRLKLLGYRIVQAPDALLTHHEKSSRGQAPPPGSQTAMFLHRWAQLIADDPAYHPGMARDTLAPYPKPVFETWYGSSNGAETV